MSINIGTLTYVSNEMSKKRRKEDEEEDRTKNKEEEECGDDTDK